VSPSVISSIEQIAAFPVAGLIDDSRMAFAREVGKAGQMGRMVICNSTNMSTIE